MPDEAKPAPEQQEQAQGETRTAESPQPTFDPQAFKKEVIQAIGDENKRNPGAISCT